MHLRFVASHATFCLFYQPFYFEKALDISGGASDDNSGGILQAFRDTEILVVDVDAACVEAADNWGLILLSGSLSVVVGCLALCNPFTATDVAFLSTFATLVVSGVINVGGSLFAERGYKFLTLIMGIAQLALGGVMQANPFESELGLSLGVTMSVFVDGLCRAVLAIQNPDLPGRWPTFLGGLVGCATSVYVTKCMPLTFVAAPGIAMGVSLMATGIARMSVGFAGKKLASDAKKK